VTILSPLPNKHPHKPLKPRLTFDFRRQSVLKAAQNVDISRSAFARTIPTDPSTNSSRNGLSPSSTINLHPNSNATTNHLGRIRRFNEWRSLSRRSLHRPFSSRSESMALRSLHPQRSLRWRHIQVHSHIPTPLSFSTAETTIHIRSIPPSHQRPWRLLPSSNGKMDPL